ncbi:hypothetical protein CSTERTH_00700 [Thermoclostridium stercorarium subsp. thermolacticum DSM 2910]|uniref:Glycosyltransferase 2-like domain-containing protein n=1 Tax=Thermoclostridium stercorarium subsp. thermolacticum DSM 2910 TaxID=1121336 RepID=A0A1B1YA49_THEST|nr:glycosyltransferase family 2 protein [Thermoclostridium stercorarium]ANW97653.1 hypothetical protein CSTERTH_00700 [Thermoclostridium stercorarium subsp. thermolacticum DSM 2910]
MYNDLISIIVPIYNCEKYLLKCVDSIRTQTYTNLEIILIDDGSNDNSPSLCDKILKEDCRIKVIHKDNGGVSDARNTGLKIASGKYIAFVDSDDYLEETYLELLYKSLIFNEADLSICGYIYEDEKGNMIAKTTGDSVILNSHEALNLMFSPKEYQGFLWNKLFKKELIGALQFNKEITICEDLLFVSQYMLNCKKIVYNPIPLYHYVYNTNSAINSRYRKFNYKNLSELKVYDIMLTFLPTTYYDTIKVIKYRKLMSHVGIVQQVYSSNHFDKKLLDKMQQYIRNNIFDIFHINKKVFRVSKYDKLMALLIAINPAFLYCAFKVKKLIKKLIYILKFKHCI